MAETSRPTHRRAGTGALSAVEERALRAVEEGKIVGQWTLRYFTACVWVTQRVILAGTALGGKLRNLR